MQSRQQTANNVQTKHVVVININSGKYYPLLAAVLSLQWKGGNLEKELAKTNLPGSNSGQWDRLQPKHWLKGDNYVKMHLHWTKKGKVLNLYI